VIIAAVLPDVTLPLSLLTIQQPAPVCADAKTGAWFRRLEEPPDLAPRRTTVAAPCHRHPFLPSVITSDNTTESELTVLAVAQAQEAVQWVKPLRKDAAAGTWCIGAFSIMQSVFCLASRCRVGGRAEC